MIVDAPVEYMTIYIEVEVETRGGTPIAIITGLKIEEPPIPSVPLMNPPQKANVSKRTICWPLYLMSEGMRPRPTLAFKACSDLFMYKPHPVMTSIETMKVAKIAQSSSEQCLTPTAD